MKTSRRPPTQPIQPPMVPMISLMFNLLMFFVLMPSNQSDGYLTTNLPTSEGPVSGKKPIYEQRIRIDLLDEGDKGEDVSIKLNDNQDLGRNFDALQAGLTELRGRGLTADMPVLIAPTMACHHKWVVRAFDAATGAHFTKIHFAVPYE